MKRYVIIILSIFLMFGMLGTEIQGKDSSGITWTILWQGYGATGEYKGELLGNKPSGKGKFEAIVVNEEGEKIEKISYSGQWKNGMLDGKGVLINHTNGITYDGKFKSNKLNGKIKIYNNTVKDEYVETYYDEDIPYGVSWQYSSDKKVIGYNQYLYGMSFQKIEQEFEKVEYGTLLYYHDEYQYKKIKLECKILDTYRLDGADGKICFVKVKDQDNNKYIIQYDVNYEDIATNYTPVLEKGDKICVYGYCRGIDTFAEETILYPCIDSVYVTMMEENNFELGKKNYTYSDFIDFPYFFYNKNIKIEGKIKGIYQENERWISVYVEVENPSKKDKEYYICSFRNNEKNLKKLSTSNENIIIRGYLKLLREGNYEGKNEFLPLVVARTILN